MNSTLHKLFIMSFVVFGSLHAAQADESKAKQESLTFKTFPDIVLFYQTKNMFP